MSERYQKIIAKLEAKIKPMHDELKELKDQLEISSLDREFAEEKVLALEDELAQTKAAVQALQTELDASHHDKQYLEQLSEKNIQLGLQVTSLEQQIADLQELQRLNDQLEESHLATQKELQTQISALETAVFNTRSRLKAAERRAEDLQAALENATPRASVEPETRPANDNQALEAAKLALEQLKIDLEATKLDLRAAKSGLFPLLAEITGDTNMFLLELWSEMDPTIKPGIQGLFDKFKVGDIQKERLVEETKTIKKPTTDIPWPAAQIYFKRHGHEVTRELTQAQIEAAIADPSSLAGLKETVLPEPTESEPEHAKPGTRAAPTETSEISIENETLKVRLQIIEAKAEKARELAAKVAELEGQTVSVVTRSEQLEAALAEEQAATAQRDTEIARLKEAEVPANLDTATFTQMVRSLRSTVGYLSTARPSFDLPPLETRASNLVPLARSPQVGRYMAAIDEFEVVPIGRGWRPRHKLPAAAAAHQAGTLAILAANSPC